MVLDLVTIALVSNLLVDLLGGNLGQNKSTLGIINFISHFDLPHVLSLICLRFLLQLYQNLLINKFSYGQMREMTLKTLQSCMETSHENFSTRSVGGWVHLISTESENYAYHYLKPKLSILADLITLLGILSFLLVSNYQVTISLLIILALYGTIMAMILVPILRKFGRTRLEKMTFRNSLLNYLLNNWLVNKISREEKVVNHVSRTTNEIKHIGTVQELMKQVPRSILELLIFSFIPIVLFMNKGELIDVNTLAIFGLSAIRILPLFNKFMQSLNSMAYGAAAYKELNSILNLPCSVTKLNNILDCDNKIIEFDNITKNYQNTRLVDFRAKIHSGHTLITGPSGSGKSTLIRVLLGIEQPDEGWVKVSSKLNHRNIEYIPQKAFIAPGSLISNYGIGDKEVLQDILERFSLLHVDLEREVADFEKVYSGGELQRLKLALCVYKKPRLLILDEALNAVDVINRQKILKYLLTTIDSVIMISHDISDQQFFKNRIEL